MGEDDNDDMRHSRREWIDADHICNDDPVATWVKTPWMIDIHQTERSQR